MDGVRSVAACSHFSSPEFDALVAALCCHVPWQQGKSTAFVMNLHGKAVSVSFG